MRCKGDQSPDRKDLALFAFYVKKQPILVHSQPWSAEMQRIMLKNS